MRVSQNGRKKPHLWGHSFELNNLAPKMKQKYALFLSEIENFLADSLNLTGEKVARYLGHPCAYASRGDLRVERG